MTEQFDLAVVGAGPAGIAAAVRAAELGASVVLIERADHVGGTCVNTGCVPTRALAKAARLMREIRAAGAYGIRVSDPELDWSATATLVRERVGLVRESKADLDRLEKAGVDVRLNTTAEFTDADTLRLRDDSADGTAAPTEVTASSVILCVGGHSRVLPIPGAEHALLPEHILTVTELPRSVAIIGGGNTGAQVSTILHSFGVQVTLLDVAPRILMPSDPDVSEAITHEFTRLGINVRTGLAGVDSLEKQPDGTILLTWRDAEGDDPTTAVFDVVIMAAGWPANVEGLGLEEAGVEIERSAVAVDRYFRSSAPHIFAVGDLTGQDMLVQAAQFEAEAAAENAVLGANRATPHHLLPVGAFTDPDYASVGLTEEQARERDPQCVVALARYDRLERAIIDDRAVGFLKLIADSRRSLILGAHAVGENAVEVIQAVTTAMAAGADVSSLAAVKFAYPTYTAIVGVAARDLLKTAPTEGSPREGDLARS
ncbi:dihydrolipoyl dehydrogenase family protein [Microbacterium aurantiacum]|uniref:Pyridine nucleotide-disulfide oxidoreductase n=1 Tax=Microbacterium aurantiacum TaxID=162393 RepID=A0A0M8MKD5_9MICO|nr:NAD(P)/FAD-dependent oxidoreductase [Microbacterium chocolatum]ANG85021.1 pyridine nucleotide-disulfide oxidoreductase [Microbacterium chocolatum]KOS11897.1 pyridine nucleotide-disulfide oxidoreductase [Microbacterium chocolatum]